MTEHEVQKKRKKCCWHNDEDGRPGLTWLVKSCKQWATDLERLKLVHDFFLPTLLNCGYNWNAFTLDHCLSTGKHLTWMWVRAHLQCFWLWSLAPISFYHLDYALVRKVILEETLVDEADLWYSFQLQKYAHKDTHTHTLQCFTLKKRQPSRQQPTAVLTINGSPGNCSFHYITT